ncbi:30S ribosomal protein S14 [Nocardia sp.]|uniref:30S ribosomal protein S14 n=1 Tax=Nocardia sp. TaxID=1821 RepID=UPI0039C963E2
MPTRPGSRDHRPRRHAAARARPPGAARRFPRGIPAVRRPARAALRRLPPTGGPVGLRNRDAADGRPRGHLRQFGLSRVRVREMAHRGELPGVHKSSW